MGHQMAKFTGQTMEAPVDLAVDDNRTTNPRAISQTEKIGNTPGAAKIRLAQGSGIDVVFDINRHLPVLGQDLGQRGASIARDIVIGKDNPTSHAIDLTSRADTNPVESLGSIRTDQVMQAREQCLRAFTPVRCGFTKIRQHP